MGEGFNFLNYIMKQNSQQISVKISSRQKPILWHT